MPPALVQDAATADGVMVVVTIALNVDRCREAKMSVIFLLFLR